MSHSLIQKYCPECPSMGPFRSNQEICESCGIYGEWPQLEIDQKVLFLTIIRGLHDGIKLVQEKYKNEKNDMMYDNLTDQLLRLLRTARIYDGTHRILEACLNALTEYSIHYSQPLLEYMIENYVWDERRWRAPERVLEHCEVCCKPQDVVFCPNCILDQEKKQH